MAHVVDEAIVTALQADLAEEQRLLSRRMTATIPVCLARDLAAQMQAGVTVVPVAIESLSISHGQCEVTLMLEDDHRALHPTEGW